MFAVKFIDDRIPPHDLTYNDVFMTPSRSAVTSRLDVDLTAGDGTNATIPITAANMTAVSGKRMAETLARRGGIAILPQDIPLDIANSTIAKVKNAHPVYETPIVVSPTDPVAHVIAILGKRSHRLAVVTDNERPVGIVTEHDILEVDRFSSVAEAMTTDFPTVTEHDDLADVFELLERRHIKAIPVLRDDLLLGLLTKRGILRSAIYTPNLDEHRRLAIGAAIGINGDVSHKAATLLAGNVDVLIVDTAHGHQEKMIDALKLIHSERNRHAEVTGRRVPIAAGNVVTASGARDLARAGADIIKVGVGPGAMCTTRMMTGVGRPQFSAVLDCSAAAREENVAVWADGGVKHPRDVALALAAGASSVMIGSWFAGTYESPSDLMRDTDGRLYKESFGMASARAVKNRTKGQSAYQRARSELFEEGISSGKMYLDPERPGVEDLLDRIISGVRSSFTYAGARTISEFHENAVVGIQSAAGYDEGRPRHTSW
ncbi:Inosine-5'-monophosphate dehydrogenase [Dermatophilus congolensis]|uniref:GMP reductase n=1 Tax=Dermatophilus congolensis TaxID=1863 RepID=A0AA46BMX4_9MICO|nr:Inosine-5'-monophosphate dehydrogenase [Dermatophilus congolensis]